MRLSVKLAGLMVAAVAVAAASPFIADYTGPDSVTGRAIGGARMLVADTASGAWSQMFALLPADGSSAADGTPLPADAFQVAQAAPAKPATPTPTPAKPTTPAPTTAAKPPAAPAAAQPTLSQSDLALVMILLRNTLVALHQANTTGNYTVLRDLGAPGFRDANTATRLAEIFAPIRAKGVDLSGAVLVDPKVTVAKINEQGMLDIVGSMAVLPVPVNFELLYQAVSNTWQLFGISITAADNAPQAAAQPAPQTSAPAAAVKPPVPAARP